MKKFLLFLVLVCTAVVAKAQLTTFFNVPIACAGSAAPVEVFFSDGSTVYMPGNVFTAELSDASGSFAAPTVIGTLASVATSGSISATIPTTVTAGTGYRIRVVSSAPAVTGTDGGIVFSINTPPPVPSVASNTPVCEGGALIFSAFGPAGAQYSWVGPGITPNIGTVQNPAILNVTPAHSGLYTAYTYLNGCYSAPAVSQVIVHPAPAVPVVASNSPICPGNNLTLSVTNPIPGSIYNWYHPLNPGIMGTGPVLTIPNAQPILAGTWQVFVSDPNGCGQNTPGTTLVNFQSGNVNASSNSPLCEGSNLMLSATTVPGATFSWSGPNGFSSSVQNPTIFNAGLAAGGTYHVWVTANGCTGEDTVHVQVNAQPMAPVPTSNSPVCEGQDLVLMVASPNPNLVYEWTTPNGLTATGDMFVVSNVMMPAAGTYQVQAFNNGCASPVGLIQVSVNPSPSIFADATADNICLGQSTTINAYGSNMTFTWSPAATLSSTTGATVTATPTATTTYTVIGTDPGSTCPAIAEITITVNGSGFSASSNSPVPTLGTILLEANGNNPNTVYSWTGPNNFSATGSNVYIQNASAANAGTYSVTYQDPGCGTITATVQVTVIDMSTASGMVYSDDNNNGTQDAGELPLVNVLIEAQPGGYFASTDSAGNYAMALPNGSYTLTPVLQPNGQTSAPASHAATFTAGNQTDSGNNFGLYTAPVQDLAASVYSYWLPPIPGFVYTYYPGAYNYGTTASGQVKSVLPAGTVLVSASPGAVTSGDTLIWSFTNLPPYQYADYEVSVLIPATMPLGTVLELKTIVTPIAGDITPLNNTLTYSEVVVGSYDPNDKAVSPAGPISPAQVAAAQDLTYKIRFQNTGTFMAFNILVTDTLSSLLDVSTFRMLATSHNCNVTLREQGILEFHFPNIMLPDSNSNEPLSHGYIQYSIKPKTTLQLGDEIENTAHIFFDFNEAIVTNTTSTVVALPNGIAEAEVEHQLHVYPNPNNGVATLRFTAANAAETTVTLLNLLGQEVLQLKQTVGAGEVEIPVDLQQQPAGIYLVRVVQNGKVYSTKLVRQ